MPVFSNVAGRAQSSGGSKKGRLPEGIYKMRPTKAVRELSRKGADKITLECTILAKGEDYNGALVRHHYMLENENSVNKLFRLLYLVGADMRQFEGDDGTKLLDAVQDLVEAGPVLQFKAKPDKNNEQYNNWYLEEETCPVVYEAVTPAPQEAPIAPPPPAQPAPAVQAPAPVAAPAPAPAARKNPFAR